MGNPTAWVCYGHGRLLCEALQLADALRLLDYPPRNITLEAQQVGQMDYLLGYIIFPIGETRVELRKVDFWINATHITYAARRSRNTLIKLWEDIDHEIVRDYNWQGTYVDYEDGLLLSKKYKLDLLTEGLERVKEASWQDRLGPPDSNNSQGKYEEAEQMHRQALKLREKVLG
jgi:hypothetical protein